MTRDELIYERQLNKTQMEKDLAPLNKRLQKLNAEIEEQERPKKQREEVAQQVDIVRGQAIGRAEAMGRELEALTPAYWREALAYVKDAQATSANGVTRAARARHRDETREQHNERIAAAQRAHDERLAKLQQAESKLEQWKAAASDAELPKLVTQLVGQLAEAGVMQFIPIEPEPAEAGA